MKNYKLDHIDIVVTHNCNMKCKFCIDKFRNKEPEKLVSIHEVENFLNIVRKHTDKPLEVLLLGGEPYTAPVEYLKELALTIIRHGFVPIASTNGTYREKIHELMPYIRWTQITVRSDKEIDYWRTYSDRINIKLSGDATLTQEKLNHFIEYTKDFERRSVSMYFTPDFQELCTDKKVWDILDTLKWKRNGSYMYAFYKGVRFKRCIFGETNVIDEPSVPKIYPNGVYNKTWCDEYMDNYLD